MYAQLLDGTEGPAVTATEKTCKYTVTVTPSNTDRNTNIEHPKTQSVVDETFYMFSDVYVVNCC